MSGGLALMKNVITPLAKHVLMQLWSTALATDKATLLQEINAPSN